MRYLITGGAGFIGSHLADALLARGDAVPALDDLSTGLESQHRPPPRPPQFQLVRGTRSWTTTVIFELVADVRRRSSTSPPPSASSSSPSSPLDPSSPTSAAPRSSSTPPRDWPHDPHHLDLRDLRQERHGSPPRRRRPDPRIPVQGPLVLQPLQGGRRDPRPRLPAAIGLPTVVVRALQHRRPPPDRRLRDGRPPLRRQALPARPSRSTATASSAAASATSTTWWPRSSSWSTTRTPGRRVQRRRAKRGLDQRARPADPGGDRLVLRHRACPVRRRIRGRIRGHGAAGTRHLEDPRPDRLGNRRSGSSGSSPT